VLHATVFDLNYPFLPQQMPESFDMRNPAAEHAGNHFQQLSDTDHYGSTATLLHY